MEILLIACVHGDPRGRKKLFELLAKEKPTHVFIELSPWGLFFRKRYSRFLLSTLKKNLHHASGILKISYQNTLKHPSIQSIIVKFLLPYEYRAACEYASLYGATVCLLDSTLFSIEHTSKWWELIDTKNLTYLLQQNHPSLSRQVTFEYIMASQACCQSPKFRGDKAIPSLPENKADLRREKWLLEQLKLHVGIYNPRKCAYVGGWRHFVPSSPVIESVVRTRNIKSQIVILSDPPEYIPPVVGSHST